MIVGVIRRYHPEWEPPPEGKRTWIKTRCPFHGDDNASAGVSYELDSFSCLGCGLKGNSITLIQRIERCSYGEAARIAEEVSSGSNRQIPQKPARKSSRSVFD